MKYTIFGFLLCALVMSVFAEEEKIVDDKVKRDIVLFEDDGSYKPYLYDYPYNQFFRFWPGFLPYSYYPTLYYRFKRDPQQVLSGQGAIGGISGSTVSQQQEQQQVVAHRLRRAPQQILSGQGVIGGISGSTVSQQQQQQQAVAHRLRREPQQVLSGQGVIGGISGSTVTQQQQQQQYVGGH